MSALVTALKALITECENANRLARDQVGLGLIDLNAIYRARTALSEPARPDLLEKLTYHRLERDDLTPEEVLSALASGWKTVRGRTERQMLLQLLDLMASQPATPAQDAAATVPVTIDIDFKQATELLDAFGGEPSIMTLRQCDTPGHSGVGLYAWPSDYPEEGSFYLGVAYDDAAPTGPRPACAVPGMLPMPPFTLEQRAAACVAACEGLPDHALYGGWTAAGLSRYAKSLEATQASAPVSPTGAKRALHPTRHEFKTAKQAGLLAGDGQPCNNDHDPDCRWPECNCRSITPATEEAR